MKIADMTWADVEIAARRDPRAVLPLGSTEQHAQLSLCVDAILAERVAVEAAEPLGVPVYPVMPYGLAPYFTAYPGTVSLRVETRVQVMKQALYIEKGQDEQTRFLCRCRPRLWTNKGLCQQIPRTDK